MTTQAGRTDSELLTAIAAASDREALADLYQRHAAWIVVRLERRCSDRDTVDSALQDTFISVWRDAAKYQPSGEVGAWLWTIALRRLIDLLRKRRPDLPMRLGDNVRDAPTAMPPPPVEVHDLLARLPPDLQTVVEAVYLDQLTTAETATLLGIPQGTVKSRLSRARSILQEALS